MIGFDEPWEGKWVDPPIVSCNRFMDRPTCRSVLVSNAEDASGVYQVQGDLQSTWALGRQVYKHVDKDRYSKRNIQIVTGGSFLFSVSSSGKLEALVGLLLLNYQNRLSTLTEVPYILI